jgi:hypothetical protein
MEQKSRLAKRKAGRDRLPMFLKFLLFWDSFPRFRGLERLLVFDAVFFGRTF